MLTDDRPALFLTVEEMTVLTGRKIKSKQIEALRKMAIPFFVNAIGHPIVARAAVEPGRREERPKEVWAPKVLREKP